MTNERDGMTLASSGVADQAPAPRRKRRLGRWFLAVLALVALVLTGAEVHRRWRREPPTEHSFTPELLAAAADAEPTRESLAEAQARLEKPEAFDAFRRLARERLIASDSRHKRLEHMETFVVMELDDKGKQKLAEENVDRVYFVDGKEKRDYLARTDLLKNKKMKPSTAAERGGGGGGPKPVLPFSREEKEGDYHYRLMSVSQRGGATLVEIAFDPTEPLDGKVRGRHWADAETAEPVHFDAASVKLPVFVDRFEIELEFGPAETGYPQLRRSMLAGSGGFAFLHKRFRVESRAYDYKPGAGK